MPVYFILSKSDFPEAVKEKAAKSVTDAHCTITGAPSNFVTVLFLSGYHLKKGKQIMVLANIRIGGNRSQEIIEQLERGIRYGLAIANRVSVDKIGLEFLGVHPNWIWEGGKVMPLPGEENMVKTASSKRPTRR